MPASRRAKACTGCRQVKLACDAPVRTPCTRCRDRNLECRFDSNFKRISTRGIVRDMTNEFNNLRASTEKLSPHSNTSVYSHQGASPRPNDRSRHNSISCASQASPSDDQLNGQWLQVEPSQGQTTFVSGNVSVSREIAIDLFLHFDKFLRFHAPFLEPVTSLTRLFARSPLLFWTVALVASQTHPRHSSLYEQIYGIQHELLSNTIHGAAQNIENVHALLVLCLWPVPNVTGSTDPSWNHVGLAISTAQQLLCHRPLPKDAPMNEYNMLVNPATRNLTSTTQNITWASCFDISTEFSTFHGFPPHFCTPKQFDSVEKAKSQAPGRINAVYAAKLEIKQVICIYHSQLDAGEDPSSFFSQAIMFDRSLDQIKASYQPYWNSDLEINLDGAKLYLYAFTFLCSAPGATSPAIRSSAQHYLILQKAWTSASRLIANMTDLSLSSNPEVSHSAGLLGFYPKHYFTKLFFASVFLFRILVSGHGQAILSHDRSAMIASLQSAHKIFQSFPAHRDHTRAAINIELLVKILRDQHAAGGTKPDSTNAINNSRARFDSLVLENRLSASIMWDAIFRVGEERNISSRANGRNSDVGEWKTMTEQFRHRLPSVPRRPSAPMSASFQPTNTEALNVSASGRLTNGIPPTTSNEDHRSTMMLSAGQAQTSGIPLTMVNGVDLRLYGIKGGSVEGQIPEWWTSWDAYMEDFGIGMENFPEDNGFLQFG